MIEVTEEMRKAFYAAIDGRCPTCSTSLEVRGGSLVEEDGELFLDCPVCGWSNEPALLWPPLDGSLKSPPGAAR